MDDHLTEQGRRLASERDDLIAAGVDPADLLIPTGPTFSWQTGEQPELYRGELARRARDGIRALLELVGRDPDDPGVAETPARVVRAYVELCEAPGDPAELLSKVFQGIDYPDDELITVGPIAFTSVCEHHLLPFTGHAWIGYLPSVKGVVGLSKLPRLLEHYARRPQVQERLTTQVADALVAHLDPEAAGCIIKSTHSCMSLRGVRKEGALMTTSVLRGRFKTDPAMRAEFLALTHS